MNKTEENKDEKPINIHEGHRERLLDAMLSGGFDGSDAIQKVEAFLFFIVPRIDTNPLAHRLLDKFGNFANIVEADPAELVSIKGISTKTAQKIKLFGELFHYYAELKVSGGKISLDNNEKFLNLLEGLMRFKNTENLYLFGFDHNFKLLAKRKYSLNLVSQIGINPAEIFAFVSSCKAKFIIFSHNHPGGTARPSQNDVEATNYLTSLCESWDCELLDSIIVGEDGIFSIKNDAFLTDFNETCKFLDINNS